MLRRLQVSWSEAEGCRPTYLLAPTDPLHALIGVLHNRLDTHPGSCRSPHVGEAPPCAPTASSTKGFHPIPHAALQRTLTGHTTRAASVAISPDGT
ncbi:hypothetical protein ADK41_35865 [Streptomyces caelestis]|uniref:Uncharacterized protein n=1 Tax=Streptomyces caelestis TaxID=36816 RepID=A0A0M8QFN6_9ACTN|nr:hypothetical protein ADK41_35865 [Streptomyces caelestis]